MTRSIKTLVVAFFLSLACAFGVMNFASEKAFAEVAAPGAGATIEVVEEGFYLNDTASVRISGKAIKFTTTVTKAFHESLEGDVTYIATMNIVGSEDVIAKAFPAPDFTDKDVVELNAYLNFENATDAVLEAALAADFETATYALAGDVYYQAANSNEVDRSMRAVANSAYLNWTEEAGYEKADVEELGYFTNGYRTDKEFAVVGNDNVLYVNVPNAPAGATVYVDDAKVVAAYDEATDKYTVADYAGSAKYVTVMTADGKAYSSPIAEGKYYTISTASELAGIFGVAGTYTGNYAIVSDIEVGEWAGVDSYAFNLTLNGLGYTLSNMKVTTAGYSALIRYSHGATVKNLNMVGTTNLNGALLFGWVGADVAADPEKGIEAVTYADTVIDNVVIFDHANAYNSAPLADVQQHKMIVKDSMFVTGKHNNWEKLGGGIVFNNIADIETENTIVVYGVNGQLANAPARVKGAYVYETMGDLYNADKANDFVTDEQWAKLTALKAFMPLNAENITDLLGATDGIYVITEDIDMEPITRVYDETLGYWTYPWAEADRAFTGVLDGADYVLSNVYLSGFNNTHGNYEGFLSSTGAIVTNFNINVIETGYRGGVFGRTKGLLIHESVIKFDNSGSFYAAGIMGVVDAATKVEDSFFYIGSGYTADGDPCFGWYASTEGYAGPLQVKNLHVVNASLFKGQHEKGAVVFGKTDADVIKTYNGSASAVKGEDYFYYTYGMDYVNDTEKAPLPANVVAAIDKVGAIVALNQENIGRAKQAPGGFWYLTEDIDVSNNGNNTLFDWARSGKYTAQHTIYWGAAIQFDGCGYSITGMKGAVANHGSLISELGGYVVVKNVALYGTTDGRGSAANFLFGLYRRGNLYCNKMLIENVFIDLQNMDVGNGAVIINWTNFGADLVMDGVFINVRKNGWQSIFTGHVWSGNVIAQDVFVVFPLYNGGSVNANQSNGTVVYKDFDGNTITPGGDGDYDYAITITTSLDDMKALNDGEDWAAAVELFADLDATFFA